MNTPFVRWLLDLDVIPADAEGLRLVWERPLAAWVWVLLIMGAALLAAWSYSRLMGNRRGRIVLAATRFVLVIMMLLVLSGPMLELPRETVEQDWVLMLLDRSASMAIEDVADDQPTDADTGRRSRDEQLRELLAEHAPMWAQLAEKRHVVWLGFHDGVFDLIGTDDPGLGTEEPMHAQVVSLLCIRRLGADRIVIGIIEHI